jgi:transketolase
MICRKEKMARVKMNNEYRTKISNQVRNALDHDKLNSKRETYLQHLELTKEQYPKFFSEAETIVKRSYPKEHCDTLNHFKNLYGSPCDVVAKDSCYYFAYTDNEMSEEEYQIMKSVSILISN